MLIETFSKFMYMIFIFQLTLWLTCHYSTEIIYLSLEQYISISLQAASNTVLHSEK